MASPQTSSPKASLLFSISDKVGGLREVLDLFKAHNLNLSRIESKPSHTKNFDYDFFVDFNFAEEKDIEEVKSALKALGVGIDNELRSQLTASVGGSLSQVPYFPRKVSDLDAFAHKTLEYGAELSADHPGFTDQAYRTRRAEIVALACTYKHGSPIPRIEYTEEETNTWRIVYTKLREAFPTHACRAVNYVFPLLEANCGYGPDRIPQLEDVSNFLQGCTGFRLRPVTGLLSSRDFLNGLAFRVFHSTQYIRHHSEPFYTPEPDVCHELLGHVPLFADPDFADFSQEIGLCSLGASDEDIAKLSSCYWYTVEFGVCKEGSGIRAYGAGLLSSFGELKYSLGGDDKKPEYRPFNPVEAAVQPYPVTTYQPVYFVAESFNDAKEKLMHFAKSLDRKFSVRYNPLTQSVDIIDTRQKLKRIVKDVQNQLGTLAHAIDWISGLPD